MNRRQESPDPAVTREADLAEFHRGLLGRHYRRGEEPPIDGSNDDADWLVLLDANGSRVVTVQE